MSVLNILFSHYIGQGVSNSKHKPDNTSSSCTLSCFLRSDSKIIEFFNKRDSLGIIERTFFIKHISLN